MLPTLSRALKRLDLPVIAAPLPTISTPRLVVAQCKAGIVGSLSALNARSCSELDEWLVEIAEELGAWTSEHSGQHAAPSAVKQVIHANNRRLYDDMEVLLKHKVPIVITSQGLSTDANDAVHAYGGMTLHEVINNGLARNAIDKGSDGLIALAAGAGGNAGIKSPFALIQEIRQWFLGPLVLSGAISTGAAILAARVAGADFAYIGSAFIATDEARASTDYKQAIISGSSDDVVYTSFFNGVRGNYLAQSVTAAGFDPDNLPEHGDTRFDFGCAPGSDSACSEAWPAGQGIGAVDRVRSTRDLIEKLSWEYHEARMRVLI